MQLPTIKVAREDSDSGYAVINEADFNAKEHKLFEGEEKSEQITRESIADMRKGDVRDLLEAHGVEDIPRGVDEMRELAVKVVFSDL